MSERTWQEWRPIPEAGVNDIGVPDKSHGVWRFRSPYLGVEDEEFMGFYADLGEAQDASNQRNALDSRLSRIAQRIGKRPLEPHSDRIYHEGLGKTHLPDEDCEWCRDLEGYWND